MEEKFKQIILNQPVVVLEDIGLHQSNENLHQIFEKSGEFGTRSVKSKMKVFDKSFNELNRSFVEFVVNNQPIVKVEHVSECPKFEKVSVPSKNVGKARAFASVKSNRKKVLKSNPKNFSKNVNGKYKKKNRKSADNDNTYDLDSSSQSDGRDLIGQKIYYVLSRKTAPCPPVLDEKEDFKRIDKETALKLCRPFVVEVGDIAKLNPRINFNFFPSIVEYHENVQVKISKTLQNHK